MTGVQYSILLPIGPNRPEQVIPFANLVKWAGADRLWQGQGLLLDSHHLATWLAGIGIRVPTGFGVSLMPFRSPYQAAIEARSVALATGQSVIAGFGPGSIAAQQSVMGKPYDGQIAACREYVQVVRDLLRGETADLHGDHFSVRARLIDHHPTPVSIGLGVLRERMAALAGEVADVAITWLGAPKYVGDVLIPAIRAGENRAAGTPTKVTAIVPVAVARQGRDLAALAGAACGNHVRFPHYQDALRRAGIEVSGDGGPDDAMKLVDGGVFLYGTVEEIHARLDEYRAIGVDEVVLNASGVGHTVGPRAAAQDLLDLLNAVPGREAPGPHGKEGTR
ncbi:LLM class flavin-dependent oxidoreductase [Streptomyces yerevanensis]|uniref:LLM class flavin-dependent oxidoreductase n=1 Tax=Streptomyces yerevanensis TaxID=66378 RepID=UPI00068FB8B0|nr:LLM class flavin-dependent oxidoreductase [Streptomyces yerevanensis]